jgi:hypothetical protein
VPLRFGAAVAGPLLHIDLLFQPHNQLRGARTGRPYTEGSKVPVATVVQTETVLPVNGV